MFYLLYSNYAESCNVNISAQEIELHGYKRTLELNPKQMCFWLLNVLKLDISCLNKSKSDRI